MDWSYVSGLFDGEGSVTLYKSGAPIKLDVSISASYEPTRVSLQKFLAKNGISSSVVSSSNPLGRSYRVTIQSWDGCERFCDAVVLYVIEKAKHVELAKRAIYLRQQVKPEGRGSILAHLAEFDEIRHKLHALAHKGPALTKQW